MLTQPLLEIAEELRKIDQEMARQAKELDWMLADVAESKRLSAKNLVHYLVLRKTPIQNLQYRLHEFGLSSLASCESHTRRQIQVTLERLGDAIPDPCGCTAELGSRLIQEAQEQLFGPVPEGWPTSVMVTFDKSFIENPQLIASLLCQGMSVARINCAHDDEKTWEKMIRTIRNASDATGVSCKIHLDLAGPKLRTKLLKKGKSQGKADVQVHGTIWLSDSGRGFSEKDVVVSPQESGVIASLKVGERVFFDDGLILGRVEKITKRGAKVNLERVSTKKKQLKNEKGINFPDSHLQISSVTEFDVSCFPFAVRHADTLGFSFVRKPSDIRDLRGRLASLADRQIPLILKIETLEAVENLPDLLVEGLTAEGVGVMIARGDLAVEIGFERLVEIQEEISWLCEAAHVPVIWATQVLETLHKSGVASRAEITDAGRAALAECIMINKGDHTLEVLRSLKEITQKSRSLKVKNHLIFRPLKIAEDFFEKATGGYPGS